MKWGWVTQDITLCLEAFVEQGAWPAEFLPSSLQRNETPNNHLNIRCGTRPRHFKRKRYTQNTT